MKKISLICIILIALLFRLNNINWDSGYHLHPDERFLTMVSTAMQVPHSFYQYLDPYTSSFNPPNIGHKFYVYGIFPLILNKIFAINLNTDDYNNIALQGRVLSAVFDVFTLIFLYKLIQLLEKHYKFSSHIKYWSAFLYAIAVLPIQLSHFFTVDSFLTSFMMGSLYFAMKYYMSNNVLYVPISAIFLAFAIASKISGVYIIPLLAIIIGLTLLQQFNIKKIVDLFKIKELLKKISKILVVTGLYGVAFYLTLRLVDPYYFESSNFLDLRINKIFLENLESLKALQGRDIWFPPSIQWTTKVPVIFSTVNLMFFGIGIPYFIGMCIGLYVLLKERLLLIIKRKWTIYDPLLWIVMWVIGFYIYQTSQVAQSMRYLIFLYPFFAFFTAIGLYSLITNYQLLITNKKLQVRSYKRQAILKAVIFIPLLLWPLAFSSIYLHPHSRVSASEWMYENLENNSILLEEHWDDGLPLSTQHQYGKTFVYEEMPVFGMDNTEKWDIMNQRLKEGDYYIMSSNRGWGSIMTVPQKYPLMTQFYSDMFAGKTAYKKIKEFTSYPTLCLINNKWCLSFPDEWSEEAFTVYDHPRVLIFKKQ